MSKQLSQALTALGQDKALIGASNGVMVRDAERHRAVSGARAAAFGAGFQHEDVHVSGGVRRAGGGLPV